MNWKDELILCKSASKVLRTRSQEVRNQVLMTLKQSLIENEASILKANQLDLEALPERATPAFRDRLALSPARLKAMAESLKQVADLPDPLGEIVETRTLENGLRTTRIRSPLGVLFMIFESRPNVAIEAFSLALKAGNVILLRGGKESKHTVGVFYSLMQAALVSSNLPKECVFGITDPNRDIVLELLQERELIDVVIPRGGDTLIEFVVQNSKIPIIKNDRGMCHVYVHEDAKLETAFLIIENAKKQRPGVCNAMETLLVHEAIASKLLPQLYKKLSEGSPVIWYLCKNSFPLLEGEAHVHPASRASFDTEYLDLKLNCKIVKDQNEAIEHIEAHGSKHSEAILTENKMIARQFQNEVDAAAVYWNASTRFTDGFELGLGGELGISTQKLHVRGPVGLKELTSIRWLMDGNGQIRK